MTPPAEAGRTPSPGGDPVIDHGAAAAVPAARQVRALVVDDEPSLVRAVVGYLEREGFQVESAPDGEQALRLARRDAPDVVVLDLGLPGIDGVEVCRVLRTFSDAYIVMLTARADEMRARYDAHRVTLVRENHGPEPTVRADDDRLVEAVMSLLDNALRHTPREARSPLG